MTYDLTEAAGLLGGNDHLAYLGVVFADGQATDYHECWKPRPIPADIEGWQPLCSCGWRGTLTPSDEICRPPTPEQEASILAETTSHFSRVLRPA